MPIDISKLRASVKRLAEGRPDGRKSSNLVAIIRPLMPVIDRFRQGDVPIPWAAIAASLAEQGVVEGDGRPLSEKRLTSVVSKLKAQAAKRQARALARTRREDIAEAPSSQKQRSPSGSQGPSSRLAPELTASPHTPQHRPPISEAEILRETQQKQQHLFKKD